MPSLDVGLPGQRVQYIPDSATRQENAFQVEADDLGMTPHDCHQLPQQAGILLADIEQCRNSSVLVQPSCKSEALFVQGCRQAFACCAAVQMATEK